MALASKNFSDLITFTRASGGGRFNASGQYEWLAANVPRINYDPVTGESLGILVEEQRTNLFPRSSVFANLKEVTITAGAVTSPSGAQDGSRVAPSTVNSEHYADDLTTPLTAGMWYTFSTHVKADGSGYLLYMRVALATVLAFSFNPAVPSVPADTSTAKYGYTKLPNGWYRVWVSFLATATGNTVIRHQLVNAAVQMEFAGNGVSGLYLWGRQFEQGAFPTSYIPTSGAQVTRAADVASMNTLSPWFNQQAGSVVIQGQYLFSPERAGIRSGLIYIDDRSDNNYFDFSRDQNNTGLNGRLVEGATNHIVPASASVGTAPFTLAAAWSVGGMLDISVNGAAARNNGYNQTFAAFTRFLIGASTRVSSWQMNGHIKSIRYYPKRLTNAELQELTA